MNVLIVGASGNLGTCVTRHLLSGTHQLRLLVHSRPIAWDADTLCKVSLVKAELSDPATLVEACQGIDCVIYLAGVLFKPRPQTFLPRTNVTFVRNIVDASLAAGVGRFILVSFPHVEGETTPSSPARGRLTAEPSSLHAQTRLEAEKYLMDACRETAMTPLILRAGVIYGQGAKLTEAARLLMRRRLMAIWPNPTWVHLLSLPDFVRIVEIGIEKKGLSGVYNICDDQPVLLQDFLDEMARYWGYKKPWRLPGRAFYLAAFLGETFATIFRTSTPLTHDIVKMAMTSVVADTSRMKEEIVSELMYPTLKDSLAIL